MPGNQFDDFEDDGPDDSEALAEYARELTAAVEAFGLQPSESGTPDGGR
jgi:hypothetical protein